MNRFLIAWVCAALCGCTLLFDPGKVDSGTPSCPATTASCPVRDNTDVSCDNESCHYDCRSGFIDRDRDLDSGTSNGCEVDCNMDPGPRNPNGVVANVGASGEAIIGWPQPTPPADAYQVCTVGSGVQQCIEVPPTSCVNNVCTTTLTGLPDNQRVTTTVRSGSFCRGLAVVPPVPSASYTTINGTTKLGYQIDGACGTIADVGGGVMQVTQSPFIACLTVFQIGDALWGDGSVEVEVNIAGSGNSPYAVGVAMQADVSTGHAVGGATAIRDDGLCSVVAYREGAVVKVGAGSVFCGEPGKWTRLRLVANQGIFSFQAAGENKALRELTRWPSPVTGAATKKGRPALFLYSIGLGGQAQALIRNFRVSTDAALPMPSPSSVSYNFATGLPQDPNWKIQTTGNLDATAVSCPTLTPATGCAVSSGCAPASNASCLRLQHSVNAGGYAGFDLPTGIDVSRPWSATMRVANSAASFNNLNIVRSVHGAVLDVGGLETQPLRLMTSPLDGGFETNRWHHTALRFFPDGGTDLTLDGTAPVSVQRPQGWDRHPGFFLLGGAPNNAAYNLFITDLTVSQP
jgi:hypothetical protein